MMTVDSQPVLYQALATTERNHRSAGHGQPRCPTYPAVLGQLSDTSDVGKDLTDRQIEQGNAWHWG